MTGIGLSFPIEDMPICFKNFSRTTKDSQKRSGLKTFCWKQNEGLVSLRATGVKVLLSSAGFQANGKPSMLGLM